MVSTAGAWFRVRAFSRRFWLLVIFSLVFLMLGPSFSEQSANPVGQLSLAAHLEVMPIVAWGWVFVGVGSIGLIAALSVRWQWIGFALLQAQATTWGVLYFATWATTGYERAIIGGLTWTLIIAVLAVIAGWEEAPPAPMIAAVAAVAAHGGLVADGPRTQTQVQAFLDHGTSRETSPERVGRQQDGGTADDDDLPR